MRIAISAEGPGLDARVGSRFGTSAYLLIVDSETMKVDAMPNPGALSPSHAGIQAVILAISEKPDVLLTGYLSPTAEKHLGDSGINVVRGITGRVSEAIENYKRGLVEGSVGVGRPKDRAVPRSELMIRSVKSSARQFANAIPVMGGVVLIIGLFHAFIEKRAVASFFSGNGLMDTFWGAFAGSLFAGNPINSYIIGGEFLERGVGLPAVTAFMVAWVSVGLVQLPAEIHELGKRFALLRNGLSFFLSISIAVITVAACQLFGG